MIPETVKHLKTFSGHTEWVSETHWVSETQSGFFVELLVIYKQKKLMYQYKMCNISCNIGVSSPFSEILSASWFKLYYKLVRELYQGNTDLQIRRYSQIFQNREKHSHGWWSTIMKWGVSFRINTSNASVDSLLRYGSINLICSDSTWELPQSWFQFRDNPVTSLFKNIFLFGGGLIHCLWCCILKRFWWISIGLQPFSLSANRMRGCPGPEMIYRWKSLCAKKLPKLMIPK